MACRRGGTYLREMDLLLPAYPRTRHLEGSGLARDGLPLRALAGRHLVVEEKLDGTQVGISFQPNGELRLHCRRQFLAGGPSERQFDPLKSWAAAHTTILRGTLGARHVLYGEWCLAKHTVFYDRLPHYLFESDVFDREQGCFLATPQRRQLLAPLSRILHSVPVLREGPLDPNEDLSALVQRSLFTSEDWQQALAEQARAAGQEQALAEAQTDPSGLAEGLYVKLEQDGQVIERFKWVRPGFLQTIFAGGGHWQKRPLLENLLVGGTDLYTEQRE